MATPSVTIGFSVIFIFSMYSPRSTLPIGVIEVLSMLTFRPEHF